MLMPSFTDLQCEKLAAKTQKGDDRGVKEKCYICCDLNNAEEKEMPISFGST